MVSYYIICSHLAMIKQHYKLKKIALFKGYNVQENVKMRWFFFTNEKAENKIRFAKKNYYSFDS